MRKKLSRSFRIFPIVKPCITNCFLQLPGCSPSCLITGSVASCGSRNLRWVPQLPPHITHLYLEMNRIAEINTTSLSGLEELQVLDLGYQYVPLVIRDDAFSTQGRLKRLVLGLNKGLKLEPKAFAGLSGLQNLYLDYCSLTDSILMENYLEPLSSLESLDLFGNQIKRLQPSMFFANMTNLKDINLKLNAIDAICESDLVGFRGKHFRNLNLNSVGFRALSAGSFDWEKCGNPFRGISFNTLDLSNNQFSVDVLKKLFRAIKGTRISNLKLSGHIGRGFTFNNLNDPDHSTFKDLMNSSVVTLDLSQNRISALSPRMFSQMKEAAVIDVSQNRVNQIHRNAFAGLEGNLKMLNLSRNLLGEIYSHTFASLTNLTVLDLSENHIGVLGAGSFKGLRNLKALYLTGNSLREIGFPSSLGSLEYLLLNDNKLEPSSTWSLTRFARTVTYLNIENNRLRNMKDVGVFVSRMKNLQVLLYGGNPIRACPRGQQGSGLSLNNLKVLDLHGNSLQSFWSQLQCMDLFENLGNVTTVNLSSNLLRSLPRGVFTYLTSVVEMDLSSNYLTYVQPDLLPRSLKILDLSNNFIGYPDPAAFSSLAALNLKANRFLCDQNLGNFLSWLSRTNVTFLSPVEELWCEFPATSKRVPLLDFSAQVTKQ